MMTGLYVFCGPQGARISPESAAINAASHGTPVLIVRAGDAFEDVRWPAVSLAAIFGSEDWPAEILESLVAAMINAGIDEVSVCGPRPQAYVAEPDA